MSLFQPLSETLLDELRNEVAWLRRDLKEHIDVIDPGNPIIRYGKRGKLEELLENVRILRDAVRNAQVQQRGSTTEGGNIRAEAARELLKRRGAHQSVVFDGIKNSERVGKEVSSLTDNYDAFRKPVPETAADTKIQYSDAMHPPFDVDDIHVGDMVRIRDEHAHAWVVRVGRRRITVRLLGSNSAVEAPRIVLKSEVTAYFHPDYRTEARWINEPQKFTDDPKPKEPSRVPSTNATLKEVEDAVATTGRAGESFIPTWASTLVSRHLAEAQEAAVKLGAATPDPKIHYCGSVQSRPISQIELLEKRVTELESRLNSEFRIGDHVYTLVDPLTPLEVYGLQNGAVFARPFGEKIGWRFAPNMLVHVRGGSNRQAGESFLPSQPIGVR